MKTKLLIMAIILFTVSFAQAADVSLSWDENDTASGYKIYKSEISGDYQEPCWIGTGTQTIISELEDDTKYYFVIRAFNSCGNESPDSDEISHTTPGTCGDVIRIEGINAEDLIIIRK